MSSHSGNSISYDYVSFRQFNYWTKYWRESILVQGWTGISNDFDKHWKIVKEQFSKSDSIANIWLSNRVDLVLAKTVGAFFHAPFDIQSNWFNTFFRVFCRKPTLKHTHSWLTYHTWTFLPLWPLTKDLTTFTNRP